MWRGIPYIQYSIYIYVQLSYSFSLLSLAGSALWRHIIENFNEPKLMMVRDGCCAILIYIDLVSQFGFTELICHQYLQCASPIISKDGSEDCVRAYFRVYFSVYFPNFPTKYSCCLQKLISQLIFEPHEPIVALRIVHAESSWYFILYLSVQEYFTGFTYHWFSWQ